MTNAKVSVIIPCYNYAHFLPKCVDSVLTQAGVEVEVIVIDDCSSDDTPAVGAALAADPRVTFRRHEKNIGHIATYNEGIDWVSGEYTVLLSADDLLTPGALARAVEVMDANPAVGMTYGHVLWFWEPTDLPTPRDGAYTPQIWKGRDWIARRCEAGTSTIASPEVVVRTTYYKTWGGYRPELPHTGDMEMWLRIAAHGDIAYLRGVDQAYYRVHANSMKHTDFGSAIADLRERKLCFDDVFEKHGQYVPDAARLHERAQRALAREALWLACRAFDRRSVDSEPVDDLEAFARSTYAKASTLPESRGLRARRRLGPGWSGVIQYARPSVYLHRVRHTLATRRMHASGV